MQKNFENAENFQLGIWFVLILMLDVSAEHTEENHATFWRFRDFVWFSSAKTSEWKQNKKKIFWGIFLFSCILISNDFYGKLCFWQILCKLCQPKSESFKKKQIKVFFFYLKDCSRIYKDIKVKYLFTLILEKKIRNLILKKQWVVVQESVQCNHVNTDLL